MNKRILLVDCSPKPRQATRERLEAAGASVSIATTGADVSTALEEERFDLVLLEPVIPGLDGFKFCQGVKRDLGASAPLIVLASRIFRGARLRTMSRDAGADAYFERPQQDDALYEKIDELLASLPDVAPKATPRAGLAAPASRGAEAALLDEVIELPAEGSGEDDDSLTAMVPEPSFLDDLRADLEASQDPAPTHDPPRFDDLSAPQPAAENAAPASAPAEEQEEDSPLDLPMELGSGSVEAGAPAGVSEDEDSGLHAISESDIEDALERALGGEPGPSELGATIFPDDLAKGLGDAKPAEAHDTHKAVDSPVAFLEDVDPQAQSPTGVAGPLEDSAVDDEEGFALLDIDDGEDETERPRRATAAPVIPETAVADDSGTTGGPESDHGAEALVQSPGELDDLLERAFGGQTGATGADSEAPQASEAAAEPPPVPDSLQGMDASTADLLSSLAELETSIPGSQTGQPSQASDVQLGEPEVSLPLPAPPSPEEELTLEEIFSRVSSDDEDSAPSVPEASRPRVAEIPPEDGEDLVPVVSGADASDAPTKKRRGWRKWILGSVALGALAAGAAGSQLLELPWALPGGEPATEQAAREPENPAPLLSPELPDTAEEQVADAGLSTLRRSIDPAFADEVDDAGQEPGAEAEAPPLETPPVSRPKPAIAASSEPLRPDPTPAREAPLQPEPQPAKSEEPAPEPGHEAASGELGQDEVLLVPLGDLDEPLERLEAPAPAPTRAAVDARIRARAFINVLVGPDGRVKTSRTMMDPGYGLGEVARQATLSWRYSVPRFEGAPAEVWKTEAVEFDATRAGRR